MFALRTSFAFKTIAEWHLLNYFVYNRKTKLKSQLANKNYLKFEVYLNGSVNIVLKPKKLGTSVCHLVIYCMYSTFIIIELNIIS